MVYGKLKLSDQRYVGFKYTMLASEEYLKLDLEDTDEVEGFLKKFYLISFEANNGKRTFSLHDIDEGQNLLRLSYNDGIHG